MSRNPDLMLHPVERRAAHRENMRRRHEHRGAVGFKMVRPRKQRTNPVMTEEGQAPDKALARELRKYIDPETGACCPSGINEVIFTFGSPTPRDYWVTARERISLRRLARIWGLPVNDILKWAEEQRWPSQRLEYWKSRKQIPLNDPEALRAYCEDMLQDQHVKWNNNSAIIAAILRRGTKKVVLPTGGTEEIPLDPSDIAKLLRAQEMVHHQERLTVGLVANADMKPLKEQQEAEQKALGQKGSRIFIHPVERTDAPALPSPEDVEGEVVESD